jgi:hypothetical protein
MTTAINQGETGVTVCDCGSCVGRLTRQDGVNTWILALTWQK